MTPLAPSCMPCLCRKPCVWAPRSPSACLGVLFLLLTRSFPRFSSCLLVFFLRGAPGVISAFSLRHDSLFVLRVSFLSLPVRGSAYTTCLIFSTVCKPTALDRTVLCFFPISLKEPAASLKPNHAGPATLFSFSSLPTALLFPSFPFTR